MTTQQRWILSITLTAAFTGASGQVVPSLHNPPNIEVYGGFTFQQPNFRDIENRQRGLTAGAYFQPRSYLGLDLRAVAVQQINVYHEFSALAGPRVSLQSRFFGTYASFDVGLCRMSQHLTPTIENGFSTQMHSTNLQLVGLAGLDFFLLRRLTLHVPEVSYSNIRTPNGVLTRVSYGAGIGFRFR